MKTNNFTKAEWSVQVTAAGYSRTLGRSRAAGLSKMETRIYSTLLHWVKQPYLASEPVGR